MTLLGSNFRDISLIKMGLYQKWSHIAHIYLGKFYMSFDAPPEANLLFDLRLAFSESMDRVMADVDDRLSALSAQTANDIENVGRLVWIGGALVFRPF
jgi:hypothetical protein